MSGNRYTQEFKSEAVRQVTERGRPVAEVAEGLGIPTHTLYRWLKAVRPTKAEAKTEELDQVKAENKRLQAELRKTREERDILKKPRRTSSRTPTEVRLHPRSP